MPVDREALVVRDIVGDVLVASVVEGETVGELVCLDARCYGSDGNLRSTLLQLSREDAVALAAWIRERFCEEVMA